MHVSRTLSISVAFRLDMFVTQRGLSDKIKYNYGGCPCEKFMTVPAHNEHETLLFREGWLETVLLRATVRCLQT